MEQPRQPDDHHHAADAHRVGGVVDCVRLNVGDRPSGLAPLLTLGLAAAGVGWGATSLLVALVQSRSISGTSVAASVSVVVLAVILRLVFIQNWRARAAHRKLRAEARRRLRDALDVGGVGGAGAASDIPTLCWCVAVAAGCSNANPRPLTQGHIDEVDARLGTALPRVWIFDARLTGAVAVPAPAPALPEGRRPVVRPRRRLAMAADLVGVIGLIGAVIWAIVSTSVWFNSPRLRPAQTLSLVAPPVVTAVGSLLLVLGLHRWAARRACSVECSGDAAPKLQFGSSARATTLPFPADGLAVYFVAEDNPLVSMPWSRADVQAGPRVRLVGAAPWRDVEIAADAITASEEGRWGSSRPASTATFDPAQTIGTPLAAVEFALPRSPPALMSTLVASGVVLGVAAGVYALYASANPPSIIPRTYIIGTGSALVGAIVLLVTAHDIISRWIPEWRRRARDRARALRQLDALGAGTPEFGVAALCRLIALSHGCTSNDVRGLTNERLRAAEARFGLRLPRTWIVHDEAGVLESGAAEVAPGTPALYKVSRPAPWQDRLSNAGIGVVALGLAALAAAAAGVFGAGQVVRSSLGGAGLCCAAPLALMWLIALAGDVLRTDTLRRGPFLLLSRRGPTIFRGVDQRSEPRLGPPDAFTILFDNEAPYALNQPPKGAHDINEEQDEPGHKSRTDVVRRVRVIAPPPWGEVEGIACYRWNPVAGAADGVPGPSR